MGWLQIVGSFKALVSFAKEPYKRDDILQKRPITLRSLLIVATPYLKVLSRVFISRVSKFCLETEYRLFYRAFFQKRPIILRSLLIVATPQPVISMIFSQKSILEIFSIVAKNSLKPEFQTLSIIAMQ